MKNMKILRIISSGFEEGGVENGIMLMQPILKLQGHEVRIMASDRRMDMPRYDNYTFRAISNFKIGKYFLHLFNPYSFFLLKKILKEYKPDIVQLHTMSEVSPSVLFALKRIPTVLTIHGPEEFTPSLLRWYLPASDFKDLSHELKKLTIYGKLHYFYIRYLVFPIYRLGMHNVDAVVTFSQFMHRLIESDGISNQCIPNGTVLLEQKSLPTDKAIAYVGRLEKFKGVDILLSAMTEILKNIPNARLIIVGDGSYRDELVKIAHSLNIGNQVEFRGHIARSEVKKVYEESAIILMPSIWPEAFGKVGIEAMSVGRPVIASDVGGINEWLIDGVTGYLVPPRDANAIAEKVKIILSNQELLQKMSKNAHDHATNFSIERHVERTIKLYEEVIKNNKKIHH